MLPFVFESTGWVELWVDYALDVCRCILSTADVRLSTRWQPFREFPERRIAANARPDALDDVDWHHLDHRLSSSRIKKISRFRRQMAGLLRFCALPALWVA